MTKPLRCLVGLHHWHKHVTEEGRSYRTCDRCGSEETVTGLIQAPGIMNPPI